MCTYTDAHGMLYASRCLHSTPSHPASTAHHHTPNPTRILIPIHTHPQLYNKPRLHSESERARERGSERERASDGKETRQRSHKETLPDTIAASHHWCTPPHVERAIEKASGRGGGRSRETKHKKERETKHKRAVMTESVKSKVKEASWPSSEASTPTESNVIDSMSSSSTPAFRSNHVAVCMFACIHIYIYIYIYMYIYIYIYVRMIYM